MRVPSVSAATSDSALAVSNLARFNRCGATPATAATFATAHPSGLRHLRRRRNISGEAHELLVEFGMDPRRDPAEPLDGHRPGTRGLPARDRR